MNLSPRFYKLCYSKVRKTFASDIVSIVTVTRKCCVWADKYLESNKHKCKSYRMCRTAIAGHHYCQKTYLNLDLTLTPFNQHTNIWWNWRERTWGLIFFRFAFIIITRLLSITHFTFTQIKLPHLQFYYLRNINYYINWLFFATR